MSPNPNKNGSWASLIIEELVRLGSDTFFVSPGLRSSPLVAAVGGHPNARAVVHYDERGSAFAALGFARRTGRPAVWITTSGTALANGLPAVIEASVDAVPLLLLTADRPPELRETGANQTIPQAGLFGTYVRWFFDLPTPTGEIDPSFVLTTVDQAIYRATAQMGPVHLNCMYREPLLDDQDSIGIEVHHSIDAWRSSNAPFTRYANPVRSAVLDDDLKERLNGAKRPVCILGRILDTNTSEAVLAWAEQAGIPVLPDVLSGVRLGGRSRALVSYYDLLLATERFGPHHLPDAVIQFGRQPVSKRLQTFLANVKANPRIVIVNGPERIDPAHIVTDRLEIDASSLASALQDISLEIEGGWLDGWMAGSRAVAKGLDVIFEADSGMALSEQALAYRLCQRLPANHNLVLSSSLSIRHVDSFGFADGNRATIVANRGASGIDGTVATAAGCAFATGKGTTVLLGDQALLHDLNSLSLAASSGLTVVVINNDGGGIFSYLPIEKQTGVFEKFFAAPHGMTFSAAAELFGLRYESPKTDLAFAKTYDSATSGSKASLIEVRTNRTETRDNHRRLVRDLDRHLSADDG